MVKWIFVILVAVGAFYVYQNQDTLMESTINFFSKEKTVSKLNNIENTKQKMYNDAGALDY